MELTKGLGAGANPEDGFAAAGGGFEAEHGRRHAHERFRLVPFRGCACNIGRCRARQLESERDSPVSLEQWRAR